MPDYKDTKRADYGASPQSHPQGERLCQIGAVVQHLREGGRAQRKGWNGPGQFIKLQIPDQESKMSLPYIYMSTVQGQLVPWLASQTDILADDWRLLGA